MSAMNGWLCGAACGASAMYFFDPQLGRRRRALVRDQLDHWSHRLPADFDAAWRDLTNRAYGSVAEIGSCLAAHHDSDDVIRERVRTKAGRYLRHPAAVEVDVSQGCVTLRGPVLADEVQPLIQAVRWVRGVHSVAHRLEVHDAPGDIAALQGAGQLQGEPFELLQARWTPGIRLACGTLGGALVANGLMNRGVGSLLMGLVGFGLVARSLAAGEQQPGRAPRSPQHEPRDRPDPFASDDGPFPKSEFDRGTNVPEHQPDWPPSTTKPGNLPLGSDPQPPVM